jgi:hypothetical protein
VAYAIMPGAILIDRSFLPEPGMLAMVTTGVWLLVRYLQDERWPLLLAAGAFLTLGILAKLPGIAAGVPFAYLAVVWLLRGKLHQALSVVFVGAVTLALVAAYYAWAIHLGRSYPPYHIAGHGYIWDEGLAEFVSHKFYLGRAWERFQVWYLTWPFIILVLIGFLQHPPSKGKSGDAAYAWIFHVWAAAAGVVYLAAALEVVNNPWNFHVFSVPLAAFAGRSLYLAIGMVREPSSPGLAGVRLVLIAGFTIHFGTLPALGIMKHPYAGSAHALGQHLSEVSEPGDLVIAVSPSEGDPVAIYYSRRRGWVFPPAHHWIDPRPLSEEEKVLGYLAELRGRGARWFGVTRDAYTLDGHPFTEHRAALLEHLQATAELVADTPQYLIFRLD